MSYMNIHPIMSKVILITDFLNDLQILYSKYFPKKYNLNVSIVLSTNFTIVQLIDASGMQLRNRIAYL